MTQFARTTPEAQGVASDAVRRFVQALSGIDEIHGLMLLRHGAVIAEGWWTPYRPEYLHMLYSVSKSFTSTAVGMAVAEGRFSVDDPVLEFFPDEAPEAPDDNLRAMRVRHLLSMSTGHATDTLPVMTDRPDQNWSKGFFDVPVKYPPGTHFLYNTGASYMLAAIVQKTTGEKLIDFLRPRLFDPLGIGDARWQESPQGIAAGGYGLDLRTEDVARLGQLYLQRGLWAGQRLLPEAWVAEATRLQIANGSGSESDWAQGYGYQFWMSRHGAYRGDGAFGQYCVVMPEQDAVLAITGGIDDMQQPLDLLWDTLLPAMAPEALPEDREAQRRLGETLAGLSLPPVQGAATSPAAARVSGRSYQIDFNPTGLKRITLTFGDEGCTVTTRTLVGEDSNPCGYGAWLTGRTHLYNQPWETDAKPVFMSGAWTADDTYTFVVRLYETPHYQTCAVHFDGDAVLIDARLNVSFFPLQQVLTGRMIEG